MAMRELIFVRHGQTEWNEAGRLQGRGDSPLTPLGYRQARAHLEWLPCRRPGRLLASPLGRARATAELLATRLGLEVETDPRLAERSMGRFEGWTLSEVAEREREDALARERDPWGYRPPGGENYDDLLARVAPVVSDLLAAPPQAVVVVSHGTLARALLGALLKLEAETILRLRQPNSLAYVVRMEASSAEVLRYDGGGPPEPGLLLYE